MKDYYQIMGVGREASEKEIKRSFRRLANQYHPDKNESADAEALFKELNEAYEVLSDPASRSVYDQQISNPGFYTQTDSQSWAHGPRSAPRRRRTGPSDRMIFMLSLLKYTQLLFYFGCTWCLVLVVDYAMPAKVSSEVVLSDIAKVPKMSLREGHDLLVTDGRHHFPLSINELQHFPPGSKLHIYTSSLFSALIRVENYNGSFIVNNLGTVYRNFSFAPILLMASCLTGLIVKKGVEFHVNLGIVVFLLMVLNLVLLFASVI